MRGSCWTNSESQSASLAEALKSHSSAEVRVVSAPIADIIRASPESITARSMECEITQWLARPRTGEVGTTDVRCGYGLVGLQLGTVLPSSNVGLIAAKIHATLRYNQLRQHPANSK